MNILTLNECGLVAGGFRAMPGMAGGGSTMRRYADAMRHGAGMSYCPPMEPAGSGGTPRMMGGCGPGQYGGAGYGYLGGITPESGLDGFVDFGPQYASTPVNTHDTVTTGAYNPSTASAPATLWSDGAEIALGVFEFTGGVIGIGATMELDLDSAGLWQMVGGAITVGASIDAIHAGSQHVVDGSINLVHRLGAPAPIGSSDFQRSVPAAGTAVA